MKKIWKYDMAGVDMKNNLKICRKNKDMTAKEVSEKIGVTKQAIYNMENGTNHPSVEVLIKLSELYNVSTDYLLGLTKFENFASQYEYLQSLKGNDLFDTLDSLSINNWRTVDGESYSKMNNGWFITIKSN